MSDEHSADETAEAETERHSSVNRRRFVKTVGAIGGTAAFGAVSTTTVEASLRGRNIERLAGKRQEKVIQKIKRDKEASNILRKVVEDGWKPQYNKGRYGLVTPADGERFNIAAVPLQLPNGHTSVSGGLKWSEQNDELTGVAILDQRDAVGNDSSDFEEHTIWTEGSDVRSRVESHSPTGASSDGRLTTNDYTCPSGGCGGPCPTCGCNEYVEEHCVNWNISCIMWVIGALGISCGAAGWVGCLLGSGVALGPYTTGDGCDICDKYDVERTKIGQACG